jgi:glyoxylase-like metal-dependent hydrolase (beta-lactamase superfamily II)
MDETSFQFKIGEFNCTALCDTKSTLRWGRLFGNAPEDELERTLAEHQLPREQMSAPSTCLVIDTGQHQVLVDTGRGTRAGMPAASAGKLLLRMHRQGINPASIDTVILSHLHPGHAGGVLDRNGQLAFSNARHVFWSEEWEFWQAAPDLKTRGLQWMVTFAQQAMQAMQHRLLLVERDAEVVPGIRIVAAPGHSAGHMGLSITSKGRQLLCLADAVFHPLHLEHPLWYSLFDLRPEQSVTSRLRLLDRAVGEEALVHAYHFPFPGLGKVIPHADFWRWQPMQP